MLLSFFIFIISFFIFKISFAKFISIIIKSFATRFKSFGKELNTLIDLEMDDGHILKKTIEYGIAFHHAKLPNIIKTSINRRISAALSAL